MENKIVKYGLFWEPPQTIYNFINFWKEEVRKVEPQAIYLNHPVHSTFFLLMALKKDQFELINSLELLFKETLSFRINFTGWNIFEKDEATGGDTLTLAIQKTQELFVLQKNIASAMVRYKKALVTYNVNWKGDFAQSYTIWGFPFVGEHWLPHLSIASVNKKGQSIIQTAQSINQFPESAFLSRLALYEITENDHRHLHSFQLK